MGEYAYNYIYVGRWIDRGREGGTERDREIMVQTGPEANKDK